MKSKNIVSLIENSHRRTSLRIEDESCDEHEAKFKFSIAVNRAQDLATFEIYKESQNFKTVSERFSK